MPATAVYIVAVVGAVAAGYVFKEFVYEPHIAPKIERWAEEFLATRAARRRQRTEPIRVPLREPSTDESSHRRSGSGANTNSNDEDSLNPFRDHGDSIELERLISSEVRDWRSEVDRSQSQRLRHRSKATGTGTSSVAEAHTSARSATGVIDNPHVLFDSDSVLSTPTTTNRSSLPSRASSPPPQMSPLRHRPSESTIQSLPEQSSPPPNVPLQPNRSPLAFGGMPTPDLTTRSVSPTSNRGTALPHSVPSLSQAYAQELDLELLSAPSSRPDSPYSNVSQNRSVSSAGHASSNYQSFSDQAFSLSAPPNIQPLSPSVSDIDLLSDFDEDRLSESSESAINDADVRSEVSGSSWASAAPRNHPTR